MENHDEALKEILEAPYLNNREKIILEYFHLHEVTSPINYEELPELSKMVALSAPRLRQLHERALTKLHHFKK